MNSEWAMPGVARLRQKYVYRRTPASRMRPKRYVAPDREHAAGYRTAIAAIFPADAHRPPRITAPGPMTPDGATTDNIRFVQHREERTP